MWAIGFSNTPFIRWSFPLVPLPSESPLSPFNEWAMNCFPVSIEVSRDFLHVLCEDSELQWLVFDDQRTLHSEVNPTWSWRTILLINCWTQTSCFIKDFCIYVLERISLWKYTCVHACRCHHTHTRCPSASGVSYDGLTGWAGKCSLLFSSKCL